MEPRDFIFTEFPNKGTPYSQVWHVYFGTRCINVVVKPRGQYHWRLLGAGPNALFETFEDACQAARLAYQQDTRALQCTTLN